MGRLWTWQWADHRFRLFILARDPVCVRCRVRLSTNPSHYHRRSIWGLRWDTENVDGFCDECHDEWEGKKRTEYRAFKERQLGPRFQGLEQRARVIVKRREAIERLMEWLG